MSCQLSATEFYDRSGFTSSDVSLTSLTAILNDICAYVKAELDETFELQTIAESDAVRYMGTNLDTRKVGFWQPENLNIRLGSLGGGSKTDLVKDKHYTLENYRYSKNPGFSYAVFAVRFYGGNYYFHRYPNNLYGDGIGLPYQPILMDFQYIEVYGTKGMDGMPNDLKTLLYNIAAEKMKIINSNKNNTSPASYVGTVSEVKDLTSSISYELDDYLTKARDAFSYDILQHPAVSKYINNLKRYSNPLQPSIV